MLAQMAKPGEDHQRTNRLFCNCDYFRQLLCL